MRPSPAWTDRIANSILPRLTDSLLVFCLLCSGVRLRAAETPVPLVVLAGSPSEIGTNEGTVYRTVMPGLLRIMGLGAEAMQVFKPRRTRSWIAGLPPAHRAEMEAMAGVAGIRVNRLLHANVIVDTCCSALVSPGTAARPLMVARNMDFFPAGVTGPATVLKVYRQPGRRPFVSVSWPGYAGVVSGMNDAGVTACVLLRHAGSSRDGGTPICFRIREILEECSDLESAVARFRSGAVSSEHYLLLSDEQSSAIVWRQGDAVMRHDPTAGWLAAANGRRGADGLPADARGTVLQDLARGRQDWDDAWMRSATTATCQLGTNAQAMLWTPAKRTLDLATGTGWRAAARQEWVRYQLADVLAGTTWVVTPEKLGKCKRLKHYLEGGDDRRG